MVNFPPDCSYPTRFRFRHRWWYRRSDFEKINLCLCHSIPEQRYFSYDSHLLCDRLEIEHCRFHLVNYYATVFPFRFPLKRLRFRCRFDSRLSLSEIMALLRHHLLDWIFFVTFRHLDEKMHLVWYFLRQRKLLHLHRYCRYCCCCNPCLLSQEGHCEGTLRSQKDRFQRQQQQQHCYPSHQQLSNSSQKNNFRRHFAVLLLFLQRDHLRMHPRNHYYYYGLSFQKCCSLKKTQRRSSRCRRCLLN